MLGVAATLIGDKIRTDVQRELGGIGRATGEYSVDIDLITLRKFSLCARRRHHTNSWTRNRCRPLKAGGSPRPR